MSLQNPPLRKRVTPEDLEALRQRKVTAKELAQRYGAAHNYFTRIFNKRKIGTVPSLTSQLRQKQELSKTRKAFRVSVAARVISGAITLEQAAKECHCTIRTVYRYMHKCSKTST